MEHKNIPVGHIHAPFQWVVADAAARAALTVESGDANKLCLQQDTGVSYRLSSVSPVVWSLSNPHDAEQDSAIETAQSTANAAVTAAQQAQSTADGKATATHAHTAAQISDASTVGHAVLTATDAPAARSALELANHEQVTVDTKGNAGLGVTPAGWHPSLRSLEMASGAVFSQNDGFSMRVVQNAVLDTNVAWIYRNTGFASRMDLGGGGMQFFTAPSGAAGAVINFVQAMVLDANGRLGIGATPSNWVTAADAGCRALQLANPDGKSAAIATWYGAASFLLNAYFSPIGGMRYCAGGPATQYQQLSGGHTWSSAPSGVAGDPVTFSQAMTLDANGNLLVGVSSGVAHCLTRPVSEGNDLLYVYSPSTLLGTAFYAISGQGWNASASGLAIGKNSVTGRSINAGGTVNASGADYAEYERNNGAVIEKGAVVGFKADGSLTLKYGEAIRFGIKSTNPSYVGGDTWGTEAQVGKRPEAPQFTAPEYAGSQKPADLPEKPVEPSLALPTEPAQQDDETDETFAVRVAGWKQACQQAEAQYSQAQDSYAVAVAAWEVAAADYATALAQYEADQAAYKAAVEAAKAEFDTVTMPAYEETLDEWEAKLEAARVLADRVAYSGKVPVNVLGAAPGDYIIAAEGDDGGIGGKVITAPDFAQYLKAIGRVNRVLEDGRAEVAVIVH